VGVSVRPQTDFRVIQDETIHVGTIAAIHVEILQIARMDALPAGTVVTHHNHPI
jgi:DNA repair protein RadC